MRVRKNCTVCGKLKNMYDFLPSEEFADKKTRECKSCIEEMQLGENNSKINNNQTIKTMATLAEKRKAAEAAAKENGSTAAEAPKTEATPKAPKTPKATPKVGDTTEEGLKVVGEKEKGTKGRKAYVEKPIEQLDLATGTVVIAEYQTLKEAADAVGTSSSYLLDGLRGWAKSVAKFKWRFKGEEIVVRVPKAKTPAEKAFVAAGKTEDVPVPGDLDYNEEEHGAKPEVEEEEELDPSDDSVFEQGEE